MNADCDINFARRSVTPTNRPSFEPQREMGHCNSSGPFLYYLILLFADFFARALTRQSLLDAGLFARLQVIGVTLDFLDYVLLLYLALKTAKGVLQRFALLQSDFSQT